MFERERVRILHDIGLKTVSYCFSTGNPYLSLWPILGLGLHDADYLGLHEYGMKRMTLDGWHLLRYRKVIAALRDAGHHVPPILITETGVDYNGNPDTDGWRGQGISKMDYVAQLAAYDQELQQDPEVVAATPFTWMHQGWPSFAIDRFTSRLLSSYMKEQNVPDASFEQLLGDEMQGFVIAQNINAAFYKYGRSHGWESISREVYHMIRGKSYRAQVWYSPADTTQHIVYTEVGNWAHVRHFDREN
jgi:hypothetical protein